MMAEVYVGGVHIGTATKVKIEPRYTTLPKPARVEKWQRWRWQGTEWIAQTGQDYGELVPMVSACATASVSRFDLLKSSAATFLGYAKPDKVEAGQRWKIDATEWIAEKETGRRFDDRQLRHANDHEIVMYVLDTELRYRGEYLGMAESALTEEDTIRKCAAATGQPTVSIREAVNDIKQRYEAPPLTLEEREMLKKALENFTPRDPKAEARHANEEAAKRLIANPPEWAYPRAWMCAVLALQERANVDNHRIFPTSGDKICAEMLLEECERAHKRQPRISGVVYDPIRDVLFDAYARGMERSSPMIRQGINGGLSTCDLGVDYE